MDKEFQENQAEKLQQLFQEVNNQSFMNNEQSVDEKEKDFLQIDVLNLPPRKEVHQKPKSRFYISFKKPFLRFLFVIIILIVVLITLYYVAGYQIF